MLNKDLFVDKIKGNKIISFYNIALYMYHELCKTDDKYTLLESGVLSPFCMVQWISLTKGQ